MIDIDIMQSIAPKKIKIRVNVNRKDLHMEILENHPTPWTQGPRWLASALWYPPGYLHQKTHRLGYFLKVNIDEVFVGCCFWGIFLRGNLS